MVDGLVQIAVYRDDYAYYPDGGFAEVCSYPRSGWLNTDEPQSEYDCAEGSITCYYADLMRALPNWYRESGDEQALDLAGRLGRFSMKPRFWGGNPEPVMVAGNELGHFNHHAFARLETLHGMLECAMVGDDARILEFVQRGFEFALNSWTGQARMDHGSVRRPERGVYAVLVGQVRHTLERCRRWRLLGLR